MRPIDSFAALKKTVVDGGYCIGCGSCSVATAGVISIGLDEFGEYKARIPNQPPTTSLDVRSVCPFSDIAADETTLGKKLFEKDATGLDERLGYFRALYAGHVSSGLYRKAGSSGGTGSWILATLLKRGLVDFVIHVKAAGGDAHFAFDISPTVDEVITGAKSRYFPVEMSEVLARVKQHPGRYVLVGIPCFVKAARLLACEDAVIAERIRYTIGLVCGHLKSSRFADFLAWQCDIPPGELREIDFRHKLEGRKAMDYGVRVASITGKEIIRPLRELFGHQWGYGFFKYDACDYCDDVVAETADLTIGDAWLPAYEHDSKGTNIVIARTKEMAEIIQQGIDDGELAFEEIAPDAVAESQAGGFRHRRQGLTYRLWAKDRLHLWRPPKRVEAARTSSRRYAHLQQTRVELRDKSRVAFRIAVAKKDFGIFVKELSPLMRRHDRLSRPIVDNLARGWLRWPLALIPSSIKRSLRRLFGA